MACRSSSSRSRARRAHGARPCASRRSCGSASSSSSGRSRACTSRGLSPPGGRKSRPRASFSAIAAPSSSRSASRLVALPLAPGHLDQPRLGLWIEAEKRRGLHRAPERARRGTRASPSAAGSRTARICARPGLGERAVGASLDELRLVPVGRAVADDEERDHAAPASRRNSLVEESGGAGDIVFARGALAWPPVPSPARRSGSSRSAPTASAKAAASPSGTSSPVSPSATTLDTPPLRPATTGRPAACASSKRHAERLLHRRPEIEVGWRDRAALSASGARTPAQRTRSPSGAKASRTASSAGPAPAMMSCHGGRQAGTSPPPGSGRREASGRRASWRRSRATAPSDRGRACRRSRRGSLARSGARNGAVSMKRAKRHHPLRFGKQRQHAFGVGGVRLQDQRGLADRVRHRAVPEVPAAARLLRRVGGLGDRVGNAEPLARRSGRASPAPCDRGGR